MKKNIILLLLTFLSFNLWAQKFEGALFTGVCGSQVSGDNYAGFNKAGFILGASVRRPLSTNWNLQMEMMYVQKGSRHLNTDFNVDFYQIKVNYIEIPFLLQYKQNDKLLFEGGASFGVLINSGIEENINGLITGQKSFHSTEFALQFGTEYKFADHFGVDLRLSNSILPIREHASGATTLFNWGQYNTGIYLSLHYYIGNKV